MATQRDVGGKRGMEQMEGMLRELGEEGSDGRGGEVMRGGGE